MRPGEEFYCNAIKAVCRQETCSQGDCPHYDGTGGQLRSTVRRSVLDGAIGCVCADRDLQYGSPEESFGEIARLWEVYLKGQCTPSDADVCITAQDVGIMMALFKIARIKTGHDKLDNFIDAAGYIACAAECGEGNDNG